MQFAIQFADGHIEYGDFYVCPKPTKRHKGLWETMPFFQESGIYLHKKSGLYAIYRIDTPKPILLYIGKSKNIMRRFRHGCGHHIMNIIMPIVGSESNLMIKIKLTNDIDRLEKLYIRRLLPPLNSVLYGVGK